MKGLEYLKWVLEVSVRRNGEKPLTNAYLLNIVNLAIKAEAAHQQAVEDSLNEMMAEERKWGNS